MAEPSARPSFQIPGGARGKPAQILVLSFAAVLFSLIFLGSCTTYIHPDEVGVMESRVFGVRGVRPGTLGGGRLHFLMPGQSIHTFPTDIQLMLFSDDPSDQRLSRNVRNVLLKPAVEVNTSDGSKVGVDVTVMYRIADAYTVMQQAGPGRIFEMNAVYPKAISALKKNLGEMLAEDFYDVKKRTAKVEAAEKQIREELLPKASPSTT